MACNAFENGIIFKEQIRSVIFVAKQFKKLSFVTGWHKQFAQIVSAFFLCFFYVEEYACS